MLSESEQAVFSNLQKIFYQSNLDSGERIKRQHDLFASVVDVINGQGLQEKVWANGAFSCMPEISTLGEQYSRPHADVDLLADSHETMTKIVRKMKLKEVRPPWLRGTPLHLFQNPDGIALEIKHLNHPFNDFEIAQEYTSPKWAKPIMSTRVGVPRSGLADPDSYFTWNGVTCRRVHPELTYAIKCRTGINKDWYDARLLEMTGLLDPVRLRKIQQQLDITGMQLIVPSSAASMLRMVGNVWGLDRSTHHQLYGNPESVYHNN